MTNIYSIKDKAMGHDTIFTANNDYHAMRMTHDTVNRELKPGEQKALMQSHPEDYDLYCLGELNTDTGEIKPDLRYMQNLENFVNKQKDE